MKGSVGSSCLLGLLQVRVVDNMEFDNVGLHCEHENCNQKVCD